MASLQKGVPYYKLFAFADRLDAALIAVGTVAAVANGLAQPIMALIFGQLVNTFGQAAHSHVVHDVSKVMYTHWFLVCFFTWLSALILSLSFFHCFCCFSWS